MIAVDVYSDLICPWCLIGHRRLGQALKSLGDGVPVQVRWRAFELNPAMPRAGLDRRVYRTAKFGSWERSKALDAQVAAAGAAEGITFNFDRINRTPHTFDAHRLIWLAGVEGVQEAVVDGLFRGYFEDGRDLSDRATLLDLAATAGLARKQAAALVDGDAGTAEVRADEAAARRRGVRGVPHFVIGGWADLSGAQPVEALAAAIEQAVGERVGAGGRARG